MLMSINEGIVRFFFPCFWDLGGNIEVWRNGTLTLNIPQRSVYVTTYKAIDTVGFSASYCVEIKFCSKGENDCGRYDPVSYN